MGCAELTALGLLKLASEMVCHMRMVTSRPLHLYSLAPTASPVPHFALYSWGCI